MYLSHTAVERPPALILCTHLVSRLNKKKNAWQKTILRRERGKKKKKEKEKDPKGDRKGLRWKSEGKY